MVLIILNLIFSCDVVEHDNYPCVDGNCDGVFEIDTNQNPGSYLDANGIWHIKYSGLNYFRVKGVLDPLISDFVINEVPLIETSYDSNYFFIPGQVTWSYPVYSFLGLFTNNNLINSIPIGFETYTIPQLVETYSIYNLVGYEINKKFNFNHPAAQTMLQTYSKYTYKPIQQMLFFPDMIGDSAAIYIKVLWNSDFGGKTVEKIYELDVIFED